LTDKSRENASDVEGRLVPIVGQETHSSLGHYRDTRRGRTGTGTDLRTTTWPRSSPWISLAGR
jgi:hypothetical protein